MDTLMKKIISLANLKLLNQDFEIENKMQALVNEYGVEQVKKSVLQSGFYRILRNYIKE